MLGDSPKPLTNAFLGSEYDNGYIRHELTSNGCRYSKIAHPEETAADLIAAAKAMPGKIDYSSGGPGSPQHLAMAMFSSAAGISLTHVPYKGATQAATDVAAGQIPVGFQGLGTVAALVRGGQLRLIGVTTEKRLAQFPDVPTVAESGLPGFFFNSWFAILAPTGTPKDITARLNAEASQIRAALFSSVTHDLRTPLASIKTGVTSLLEQGVVYDAAQQKELLGAMLEL